MIQQLNFNIDNLELARDRLGLAIILAMILHAAVIFGVTFGGEAGESPDALPNIEVTLVNTQSKDEPDDADYLAQNNQEGGGNTSEKVRPETVFPAVLPENAPEVTSPTPPVVMQPKEKPMRAEVMSVASSDYAVKSDVVPEEEAHTKQLNAAQLISRSMDIASLEVEVGKAVQSYAKMPRRKFISASTKEHKYAAYLEGWRRKIEDLGNMYYPGEAKRQNLSGSLRMTVALNPDGTIHSLELEKSSGYKVLDDYAVWVVRDAAPFLPFPESITKDVDILYITRTWKFLGGNSVVSH